MTDSLGDEESGQVESELFRRRFGLPTGLGAEDQIDLVIDQVATPGRVWLNEDCLGAFVPGDEPTRFSLRGRLQNRNLLLIKFSRPNPSEVAASPTEPNRRSFDGHAGEVRLEIRTS